MKTCDVRHPSRDVTCYLLAEHHVEQLASPGNNGGVTHSGLDLDRLRVLFWTCRDTSVTKEDAT